MNLMPNKKIAKQIKKLLFTNRFTLEDISYIVGSPIEDCLEAYESYYNSPVPPSLLIVGNQESRKQLLNSIKNNKPCLLVGVNGVGKTSAVYNIASSLDLTLKRVDAFKQMDIMREFGRGPFDESNNNLYVVEADVLNKRKYKILSKYIENTKRPFVIITNSRDSLNSKITKKLEIITFNSPTPHDVEIFLRKKFNWDGDINEIYDSDMRVVMRRLLGDTDIFVPEEEESINARDCAMDLSYGYFKKGDFERLDQPIWWVIRWLAYNQERKFKNKKDVFENLLKLSYIDSVKFLYPQTHIENMLLTLKGSPRRTQFKFPPWPKKEKDIEEFKKISKKPKPKEEKIDITSWL